MLPSRNPFSNQVNSLLMRLTQEEAWENGRNPFSNQVNSLFHVHRWEAPKKTHVVIPSQIRSIHSKNHKGLVFIEVYVVIPSQIRSIHSHHCRKHYSSHNDCRNPFSNQVNSLKVKTRWMLLPNGMS